MIGFVNNPRLPGRPIFCNRLGMLESLQRFMEPVIGIHIDRFGLCKDFYMDSLDDLFWKKNLAHMRDPKKYPVPERPNPDATFNPRRSRRNRRAPQSPPSSPQHHHPPQTPPSSPPVMSPPREQRYNQRQNESNRESSTDYDPDQVGKTLYDSLKIFGLGYAATYLEVKAQFRAFARIWHPDQHNSDRTGKTDEEAKEFFQLINNSHEYLKAKVS